MVLFKNKEVADFARTLRDHGMSKEKKYWHDVIGYNYRITNVQSAIGVAQMEKFDLILQKKLKIADVYEQVLSNAKLNLQLPIRSPDTLHSNWLYGVILPSEIKRQDVIDELLYQGIETRPFFYSLHTMPPYEEFLRSRKMDNSKKISSNGLSLPTSVNLSYEEISFIAEKLIDCILGNTK
jgi:perosamine synthetase